MNRVVFENINKPQEIYSYVLMNIKKLKESILEVDVFNLELKTDKERIEKNLDEINKKLENSITNLENNSEWDKFTIAFYGETNAGKSTLIETLRILLNEKNKVIERDKYLEINLHVSEIEKKIDENREKINKITLKYDDNLKNIKKVLEDILKEKNRLILSIENSEKEKNNYESQKIILENNILSKRKKSIKNFILWLFKKLPEFQEISLIDTKIKELQEKKLLCISEKNLVDENEKKEQENIKNIKIQKQKEINNISLEITTLDKEMSIYKEKRDEYCDGKIIGDGQSDFTKNTKSYDLICGEEKFTLLDLPGIEGKETLVINEIENSLKKAHAIFYVNANATPPQSGKGEGEGIIDKIKKHLGDQTEVFFIYNKKISSPKH